MCLIVYSVAVFQILKAASPMLMRTILLGAFLLYCPVSSSYININPLGASHH